MAVAVVEGWEELVAEMEAGQGVGLVGALWVCRSRWIRRCRLQRLEKKGRTRS